MTDREIEELTLKGKAKGWGVLYKKAFDDAQNLYFPERLSWEFLNRTKREQGSYIFSNQYLNEVIPDDKRVFKKEWLRYYSSLPEKKNTFAFIDPAISTADGADFTALVVVDVDETGKWYVRVAQRFKITSTETVELLFKVAKQFSPLSIGVEDVAFQKMILQVAHQEMKKRNLYIPATGVKRGTDKSKEARIMSLQPRFEWGDILLSQGLSDLESELLTFPRGRHDDLLDALESISQIAFAPTKEKKNEKPHPSSPGYESFFIRNLGNRGREKLTHPID